MVRPLITDGGNGNNNSGSVVAVVVVVAAASAAAAAAAAADDDDDDDDNDCYDFTIDYVMMDFLVILLTVHVFGFHFFLVACSL